jgi:hypothetical protein
MAEWLNVSDLKSEKQKKMFREFKSHFLLLHLSLIGFEPIL